MKSVFPTTAEYHTLILFLIILLLISFIHNGEVTIRNPLQDIKINHINAFSYIISFRNLGFCRIQPKIKNIKLNSFYSEKSNIISILQETGCWASNRECVITTTFSFNTVGQRETNITVVELFHMWSSGVLSLHNFYFNDLKKSYIS